MALGAKDDWILPIFHDIVGAARYGGAAFESAVLSGEKDFNDPDYVASLEIITEIEKYLVPLHTADLPGGGRRRSRLTPARTDSPDVVFLPSCQGAMFAPGAEAGVQAAFLALCETAGVGVVLAEDVDSLCCGTPWSSKGLSGGFDLMSARVLDSLWSTTRHGTLPVVVDAASCSEGILRVLRSAHERGDQRRMDVQDVLTFAARSILPSLPEPRRRANSLTLHPTCSSTQLGLNDDLLALGHAVATTVHVPATWGCCGFAGDRGMLHPELTASATAAEAAEVRLLDAELHASCNRACEIGMTRATDRNYGHILELLAALHSR